MSRRYLDTWSFPWWWRGARRIVTGSLVVGLTVLLLGFVPLALLVAAALSPFVPGQWRPLRLLWILVVQAVLESLMLVVLFALWIASGFGWKLHGPRFERAHYALARWYLVVFFRECRRVLRLKVSNQGPDADVRPGEPLLVCCRHAGPGDSFVLMYALLHWYDREPRVVLKESLAWDPMVDTLLNRVPSHFVSAGQPDVERDIADLAADLDEDDAFVIFPEGGNFTPGRRVRRIQRLREKGLHDMAERAEALQHVLAPQPGGLLAALDAAPHADVILVAHTGLEHLVTVRDIWRELPMDKEILMRWWRVPRSEVPAGRQDRIDWLYSRWEDIDRWVEDNRPRDLEPLRLLRRGGTR